MAEETFQRLEPSLSMAELVFLQGWGEPLLHPRFWEYVDRVASLGPRVGFTTNGVLLDEENRRALVESNVEILAVSMAGGTDTTHDHFRAANPLATIDRHLRNLREEKERRGAEFPRVHLAYQLLASNLDELPAVLELARAWGAAEVVVSNLDLVLTPALEKESLVSRPDLQGRMEKRLEEAEVIAAENGIIFQAYRHALSGPRLACTENVLKSCFVSADGDVSPCVMANVGIEEEARACHRFQEKDVAFSNLVLGNVNDRSLEKIWRSKAAKKFRAVFRNRDWTGRRSTDDLPPACRTCNKLYEG